MSWLQKIERNLTIITGDGKEFNPGWKTASLLTSFNVSEFEFSNVTGTFVKRMRPKGNRYQVEFYFLGENNLDLAESFRLSAEDSRQWTLRHPFYGEIKVQPISLNYDNSQYNVTVVSGEIVETIESVFPRGVDDDEDLIEESFNETSENASLSFSVNNPSPSSADINSMNEQLDELDNSTSKLISVNEEFAEFKNAVATARNEISFATTKPLNAMRALQSVIVFPINISRSIKVRTDLLKEQFDNISLKLFSKSTINKSDKQIYEATVVTIVASYSYTTILNIDGDYVSRDDVLSVINKIVNLYNELIDKLDSLQSDNGSSPNSYFPDPDALNGVGDTVNTTIARLFDIALSSKQERFLFLEKDYNPIVLAHRFYGLNPVDADEAIDFFIKTNGLNFNEYLNIKKGRKIVYYV